MSHNVETMAYAHKDRANVAEYAVPWHGLGVPVSNDLTPEQMMVAAGVDWTVAKVPLTGTHNGETIISGKSALVRETDLHVLDVVSDEWHPTQNAEAFDFFSEMVEYGGLEMNTAGSLRNGQIVWALAKVNGEQFEVFKDDVVENYLLFSNPHKFGAARDIRFTPIRVVCNNTLTMAIRNVDQNVGGVVRQTHRTEFDPDRVKAMLGIASKTFAKYKDMSLFLASKRFDEQSVKQYLAEVFPVVGSNKRGNELSRTGVKALAALNDQPGAQFGAGTFWNAFNAVTYVIDHKVGRSNDARITQAWFGQNRSVKMKALTKAVEYAKAS